MKKTGVLNPQLSQHLARLGHTDTFVIADCGLPIPAHVPVVDLSLVFGIPRFHSVVEAVLAEVTIEGITLASQAPDQVRLLFDTTTPTTLVDHEEFKRLVSAASFVIRTGETTPYANAILHSGVAF